MADIRLDRPAPGRRVTVDNVADARIILGFQPDEATLERSGDDLVFSFDDGGTVALPDFYTAYSSETLPDFEIDGAEVSGADFFAVLDSTLMPAAGPAAGPGVASRNARYNEYPTSSLMEGVDHLGGLDLGFDNTPESTDTLNGFPDSGAVASASNTESYGGDTTVKLDVTPPPPAPAHMGSAGALLNENDFTAGGNVISGDIDVTLQGPGTVSVGGIIFNVPDGPFLQQGSISTKNGMLNVTVSRDADGDFTLHYDYAGNREGVEHDKSAGHDELVGDSFKLTVSDGVSSAEGSLDVNIKDGTPTLTVNGGQHAESSVVSGADTGAAAQGSFAFDFGPDNRAGTSFTVNGQPFTPPTEGHPTVVEGDYGKLTINADGSYSYTAKPNTHGTDNFEFRITDADGDSVTANIGVNVTPAQGPDGSAMAHVVVNEAGLNDGPEGADRSEVSEALHVPGYSIVGVAGDGAHGKVIQDADGNWHYVLERAIDSGDAQGANTVESGDSVKLIVQDAQGNQFTVDVPVDIVDDVPTLDFGGQDYSFIQVESGASISQAAGSINYDFGADAGAGKSFTVSVGPRQFDITGIREGGSAEIRGEYGTLTVYADGSYIYQANPNIAGHAQDNFVITITDADGDSQHVKLDIDVTPAQGPDGSTVAHVVVNEAGLNDGLEGADRSEVSEALHMPGYSIVGVNQGGQYGTAEKDVDGNWREDGSAHFTAPFDTDFGADKASDHSADALQDILGGHAQGADLYAGVREFIAHGSSGEVDAFLKGVEGRADDAQHPGQESGHDGSDHLFGGSGDDLLFGGTGNDYLSGGQGADRLYGGTGNDILLDDADNAVMDGGTGTDFLVGTGSLDQLLGGRTELDSLDDLLGGSGHVAHVEVLVFGNGSADVSSLADMAAQGFTLGADDRVSFDDSWSQGDSLTIDGETYVQMSNADDGLDVLVQQHILNNAQG